MQQGRTPPPEPLISYTVPGTGRTIRIRKLSTFVRNAIRRQAIERDPEPEPPMVEIDYGDGKLREPNRGDPLYRRRLAEWNDRIAAALQQGLTDLFVLRGIVVDGEEIDAAAVAQMRQDMAAIGVPIDGMSDRDVYIQLICIGTQEDWTEIQKLIWERSTPSEAAVQAQIATFPPNV